MYFWMTTRFFQIFKWNSKLSICFGRGLCNDAGLSIEYRTILYTNPFGLSKLKLCNLSKNVFPSASLESILYCT